MFEQTDVREGMVVRSQDGEKLGKVFAVGEGEFHIEKGLFFPKDYVCRLSEIAEIRGGDIILSHGRDSLERLRVEGSGAGYAAGLGGGAGVGPGGVGLGGDLGRERPTVGNEARDSSEVTIPVAHEELEVSRRQAEAGEIRVHKEVVEEERMVTVPVHRERARVERRAVEPGRPAMNASFAEETVVVPLRTEEVELRKRPVVEEEVVIHKDEVEEERRVAEPVRSERVEIRTDGEVDAGRKLNFADDDPKKRY